MIEKILIANRGEIAVRVIRACREMGIRTVAVYSEADKDALHTQLADEAVCIGPAPSAESYLNMQNIISATLVSGADAIHPGFGFLSENSKFAELCEQCKITYIGPDSKVISALGNKSVARNTMVAAGVPVIPGSKEPVYTVEEGEKIAGEIGYPVIVKAALGGGGKGMRVAQTPDEFQASFDSIRVKTLLSGEYDGENAIIKLNAGAGGTEACDWCGMLYRMYSRWAEKKGYELEVLDYLEGDVAGIKGVTFEVKGENAYGYLRSEKGVHRLVRISPFNAAGKRQTSFASCDVIPDIEEDIDIEINEDELRIDTYRSSGAGGQHINKTSSAIRITHLPTGIVVQCQNERSQHMNKDKAMQMLKSKLLLLKQQEQAEKMSDIRGEVSDINFGNQIRSYVMQPYTMVKDHRTNKDVGNAQSVLDGNIDPFINAYLIWLSTGKKAE